MKFIHRIAHLIIPRESNNQKAKLLHNSSLTLITFAFIFYQLIISFVPRFAPKILGFAANISPDEVVALTNEKRIQAGLSSLSLNPTLSQAAQAKGADMLNKGYWAHVAPDGTQPWVFFTNFGYKYRYAGENLARDFSSASSAVEAWMNSASHKENLLSSKYKEIGIGVVEGNLAGVDTTIIVQFFGTKYADTIPAVPIAEAKSAVAPTAVPAIAATPIPPVGEAKVLVSPFNVTKNLSLAIVGLLLFVLIVDGILVSKRRIARIAGRTFAHIAFLGMILAIVLILKAGQII
ncbi:MAG: CAP domain-containing protein [Candidatus Woesebacteria bacterium]|nr:CAP domain-containing protein [Candidatus Woesebacteria bacterium]